MKEEGREKEGFRNLTNTENIDSNFAGAISMAAVAVAVVASHEIPTE